MAAALSVTVERPGVGLGSLLLSGSDQYIAITVKNRVNAYVQFWALDASFNVANFQWAYDTGGPATLGVTPAPGTYMPALPGAIMTLPVAQIIPISTALGQNYYFKALTGAPSIYLACVG